MPVWVQEGLHEAHQTSNPGPIVTHIQQTTTSTQTTNVGVMLSSCEHASSEVKEGECELKGRKRLINPPENSSNKKRKTPPKPTSDPNPDFHCDVVGWDSYVNRFRANHSMIQARSGGFRNVNAAATSRVANLTRDE